MKKSNIRVFGEYSIAHVEKRGLFFICSCKRS